MKQVFPLRNQLIRSRLHILLEQNSLSELSAVVLVAAFELPNDNKREEPLESPVIDVVVDEVVVVHIHPERNAHVDGYVLPDPFVVYADVRHLVVPLVVVGVQEDCVEGERRDCSASYIEQVHHLVNRLVASIPRASEHRHPRLLIPHAQEVHGDLVPVHLSTIRPKLEELASAVHLVFETDVKRWHWDFSTKHCFVLAELV